MRLSIRIVCFALLLLLLITPSAVYAISVYGDEGADDFLTALAADHVSALAPDLADWELVSGDITFSVAHLGDPGYDYLLNEDNYAVLMLKDQERAELLILCQEEGESDWALLARSGTALLADGYSHAWFGELSHYQIVLDHQVPDGPSDVIVFRLTEGMAFVEGYRYLPASDITDDEEVLRVIYAAQSQGGMLTFTFYFMDPNDVLDLPYSEDEEFEFWSWKRLDTAPVSFQFLKEHALTLPGFDMAAYLDIVPSFP